MSIKSVIAPSVGNKINNIFLFSIVIFLQEKHYNLLKYELKSETISLSYVFSKMEEALNELPIEDYAVSQNTLDNVNIRFLFSHLPPFCLSVTQLLL